MMSVSVLNRGASGGLKPELTITAPAGSTIDIMQDGIIVSTYTLRDGEVRRTVRLNIGSYTVRGTLGTKVESVDVSLDSVGQFHIEIVYKLWLYREGDECEEVSGGWASPSVKSAYAFDCKNTSDATRSVVKNADNLQVEMSLATNTGSAYACASFWAINQIDITEFSKVKYDIHVISGACGIGVMPTDPLVETVYIMSSGVIGKGPTNEGERLIVELDVSELSGKYSVGLFVDHYTTGKTSKGGKVYNIWLE